MTNPRFSPPAEFKDIHSTSLDHLPAVAAIAHKIGIIDIINQAIPTKANIDMGTNTLAMILDTVSSRSPLYHVESFYDELDTEILFGRVIESSQFNDDALGRTLDRIAAYGTTKLFTEVSLEAAKIYQLETNIGNYDTTSVNVWGEYDKDSHKASTSKNVLNITYGYSKDKRPDLKQFMISMLCVEGIIPISAKACDGNSSDTSLNNKELKRLSRLLQPLKTEQGDFTYVADSKVINEQNLDLLSAHKFVSLLPTTFKEQSRVIEEALASNNWEELGELSATSSGSTNRPNATYQSHETKLTLYGQLYRALVVKSTQMDKRKTKGIENQKNKQQKQLIKQAAALQKQHFNCHQDCQQAAESFISKHAGSYWKLTYQIKSTPIYARGRAPKNGERKITSHRHNVSIELTEDSDYLSKKKEQAGCFVIITNQLDRASLNSSTLLKTYKSQYGIERNFSFLKDPLIVNDIFLKTPERIDALVMILLLSLMLWNLIQHLLRKSDVCSSGKLLDLNKRSTKLPTGYLFMRNLRDITILKCGDQRWLPPGGIRERAIHYLHALGLDESIYLIPPRIKTEK